jgi:hypothetical protein
MAIIEGPDRSHAPESAPPGTSKKHRLCYAGGVNRPTQTTLNFMSEDSDSIPTPPRGRCSMRLRGARAARAGRSAGCLRTAARGPCPLLRQPQMAELRHLSRRRAVQQRGKRSRPEPRGFRVAHDGNHLGLCQAHRAQCHPCRGAPPTTAAPAAQGGTRARLAPSPFSTPKARVNG